jgi:hypothetical protein
MKYALIDNNADYYNGKRVAQITDVKFDVHPNLKWIECDDSINEHDYMYNSNTQLIELADKTYVDPNQPVIIDTTQIPSTSFGEYDTQDILSRTELTAKIKKLEHIIASLAVTQ